MKPGGMATRVVAASVAALVLVWALRGVEPYDDPVDDVNEAWLKDRLAELHAHLAEVDPGLERKVGVVRDVRILEDNDARELPNGKIGFKSGKFKHSTGTLWVGSRDGRGQRRSRQGMLMTLLHEMAHATMGPTQRGSGTTPHNDAWKTVWLELLSHATTHLRWDVEVRCAECTYYNLCSQSQCPKCRWLQATCPPYQGGSPSDLARA